LGNGDNAFVLADKTHNQILVKAPQRVQDDYRKLIEKLDIRSPQVYIEAKIVSVTWTDDLKLAFESQLINANGTGGVLGSNFGLGTFGTGSTITTRKTVSGGLNGATLALIRSDQVPIVLNALAHKVDGRILSTPQLLVDDNVEGKIESTDKEPYSQTSQGTSTTSTGFGGNAEAGTILKVKPQISEKGYLRLKYEAELSSFTGSAVNGLPPPSQSNKISADSVTVPSDFTVVVGGLTFDSSSSTRNRWPLLGDIPILGALFGSTDNQNRKTSLYIFITPRIFRDDAFADALINTRGPQAEVKMPAGLPSLQPSQMEINGTPSGGSQNNSEGSR
jgi:general secretion pathway protein D